MINRNDFLTGKFKNIDALYDKKIVEQYYHNKNIRKNFNNRIQKHFKNILLYNSNDIKNMFYPVSVKIDNSLDILKWGFFHKKVTYRISICDCEMYLIDFNAGAANPCCLWIKDNTNDKEIIDKLNICFSLALKNLKRMI